MNLQIARRAALVLAASKGLGRASAHALAAEGVRVMIGSRDRTRVEHAAREMREATGGDVRAVAVDVTDPAQCNRAFDAATSAFGGVDILVNNAGGPPFGPFESFTEEQWQKALEMNLLSTVRFCRMALGAMKERRWGRIVNIVSLGTKSVLPGSVLSTGARLGVIGMAKLLSDEVASFGITVNNVAPGIILTDRVRQTSLKQRLDRGMDENDGLEDIAQNIPTRRVGQPEELGALVAFLASNQAAYITGSTIAVDGGAIRSIY